MGPKAGQRQMRLFGAAAHEPGDGDKVKNAYGFDIDAAVRVPAHDRKRLEALARLCQILRLRLACMPTALRRNRSVFVSDG